MYRKKRSTRHAVRPGVNINIAFVALPLCEKIEISIFSLAIVALVTVLGRFHETTAGDPSLRGVTSLTTSFVFLRKVPQHKSPRARRNTVTR